MTPQNNTKEKILTEARKLFAKKGFDGTSMVDISEKVGIEKASLYYFFRSKQDIFAAVADQNWSGLAEEFRNNPALSADKMNKEIFTKYLVQIIKNNVESGRAVLDFNVCVANSGSDMFKNAFKHRSFLIGRMKDFFKYQKVKNPDLAAALTVNAVQGYVIQAQLRKPMISPEIYGEYLTNLILS